MSDPVGKIDKPEPRWQALLALLAVCGMYVAFPPRALIAGPKWALPVFIAVLVTPTRGIASHGQAILESCPGHHVSSVITLALLASVGLLVASVPTHKEDPVALLRSGAELWLTNARFRPLYTGDWMVADRPLAVNCTNLAAVASSFHKCRSKKFSAAAALSVRGGGLILSIIFLSPGSDQFDLRSHRAPLLARWEDLAMVQIGISLTIVIVLISRAVGVL